jgi:hypothetical protein
MSSAKKKLTCNGTLRQVFISLGPRTLSSTPYTLNMCIECTILIYLHRKGGEGGSIEPEREGLRGNSSQSWIKNTNICNSSPYTLINTCQTVTLQVNFFRWRHFALVSI